MRSGSGYDFAERPTASLALGTTIDDGTPNVGQQVTFTLTIQNSGPDDATGVVVAAPLPTGLGFVSATPSSGLYDVSTGNWTIATLAEGATATLSLAASVASPAAQTLVATIIDSDQASLSSLDNTASVTEVPQAAALVLKTRFDQAAPNVGDTIHYLVTLTNDGPDIATGVTFNGLLPAGLVFVSATYSAGSYGAGSDAWTVATTRPGCERGPDCQCPGCEPRAADHRRDGDRRPVRPCPGGRHLDRHGDAASCGPRPHPARSAAPRPTWATRSPAT